MVEYTKPIQGEFADYFAGYLKLLEDDHRDVLVILKEQGEQIAKALSLLTDEQASYRYASEKWSVKEVIGHIIDMDRLFAFRCLWAARGDTGIQPGIDENLWAKNSNVDQRLAQDVWDEYASARISHLQLFDSFDKATLEGFTGVDGTGTRVNSFPWIMAAHERHHLTVLRDRYGIELF